MSHSRLLLLIALSLALFSSLASADANPPGVALYAPGDIKWNEWGISAQRAILAGDVNHRGCAYTDRVKFMANTKVDAHSLPEDKIYTVISGTLYVGFGDTWDESKLHKMPPGSFWTIPANVGRFFKTREEVVFQSTAMPSSGAKGCIDVAGSRVSR